MFAMFAMFASIKEKLVALIERNEEGLFSKGFADELTALAEEAQEEVPSQP